MIPFLSLTLNELWSGEATVVFIPVGGANPVVG
jgi:hypothetical protein